MNEQVILAFGAIALLTIGLMWFFAPKQVAKRKLSGARPTPIKELHAGQVTKVAGEIVLLKGDQLLAPLSKRRCAYYEVLVEEYRKRGDSSRWETIIREVRQVDFVVRDETGKVRVDGSNAQVVSDPDVERRSGAWNDATPELEAFLALRGESSTGIFFNKTLRYRESVLAKGEAVAVMGQVVPASQADARKDRKFVLTAPSTGQLIISDVPSTLS